MSNKWIKIEHSDDLSWLENYEGDHNERLCFLIKLKNYSVYKCFTFGEYMVGGSSEEDHKIRNYNKRGIVYDASNITHHKLAKGSLRYPSIKYKNKKIKKRFNISNR